MNFEFTKEQLAALIPGNTRLNEWYDALVKILPKYNITTEKRVAHFISQCAHESNNFRSLEENLNYSEDALNRVFSRYFGAGKRDAAEYARNPEKIANYVYMDEFRKYKMGNVQEGDGWRFRGRGLKQLTGRDNYTAFGATIGMTAEEAAEYVATESGAIESACWFWNSRDLNSIADSGTVEQMTKVINGGDIGLADRKARFEKAMQVLDNSWEPPKFDYNQLIKVGSRGDIVRAVQEKLGSDADGIFGKGTERALKEWQQANNLAADGIAGPNTLRKLLG